jgi:hypothetical protein
VDTGGSTYPTLLAYTYTPPPTSTAPTCAEFAAHEAAFFVGSPVLRPLAGSRTNYWPDTNRVPVVPLLPMTLTNHEIAVAVDPERGRWNSRWPSPG